MAKQRDRRHPAEIARGVREAIRARAQEPLPPTPGDVEEEVEKAIRSRDRLWLRRIAAVLERYRLASRDAPQMFAGMQVVQRDLKADHASWERAR